MTLYRYASVIASLIVCLTLSTNCSNQPAQNNNADTTSIAIKYATGFKVKREGASTLIEVTYPYQNAKTGYKYLLVPKGETAPPHDQQTDVITVPLQTIVCTSTTHIPLLDYLWLTDKLIGFPTTDYISSEKMRARVDAGKVTDLGIDKGMNIELLFSLKPSAVMAFMMGSDLGQLKKIKELNIPVVVNAEYLEKHPLGRAEWIKFVGLLFQREKQADSVFNIIEKEYLHTQSLVQNVTTHPTVLSGVVYGDAWFAPGGQNYAGRFFKDAGCQYLWSDNTSNGYLELSFESVYAKAKEADLWIGVGTYNSLAEIKAAEERYTYFKPFKNHQVYTYNGRKGAKGGSEFLELGYLRPDLVLKDLVKIGHPQLLPDYSLYFHKKLE
jgi:iron complex transport system substrate-binding protein